MPRAVADNFGQGPLLKARWADSMAWAASSAPHSGTSAHSAPVKGLAVVSQRPVLLVR
ncbi:hypothetical protein D9M69_581890 [compost metagenome]